MQPSARVATATAPTISPLRQRLVWILPTVTTLVWFVYVAASAQFARIARHWTAALTMVFGSFVAGSTPQGGGAVGFPVGFLFAAFALGRPDELFSPSVMDPAYVKVSFTIAIAAVTALVRHRWWFGVGALR